jgi:hypothetical protein
MNAQQILHHEPNLFPSPDDWNAFVELTQQITNIKEHWLTVATKAFQKKLRPLLPEAWTLDTNWGCIRDTKVYLTKYGPGALALGYGWEYQLHLILDNGSIFNSEKINTLLKSSKYAPILEAFDRIDRSFEDRSKAMCCWNFSFGSPNDGNIPPIELAWYAGNRTDEFVDQAIGQIKKFTHDRNVTELLTELNEAAKISTV